MCVCLYVGTFIQYIYFVYIYIDTRSVLKQQIFFGFCRLGSFRITRPDVRRIPSNSNFSENSPLKQKYKQYNL